MPNNPPPPTQQQTMPKGMAKAQAQGPQALQAWLAAHKWWNHWYQTLGHNVNQGPWQNTAAYQNAQKFYAQHPTVNPGGVPPPQPPQGGGPNNNGPAFDPSKIGNYQQAYANNSKLNANYAMWSPMQKYLFNPDGTKKFPNGPAPQPPPVTPPPGGNPPPGQFTGNQTVPPPAPRPGPFGGGLGGLRG